MQILQSSAPRRSLIDTIAFQLQEGNHQSANSAVSLHDEHMCITLSWSEREIHAQAPSNGITEHRAHVYMPASSQSSPPVAFIQPPGLLHERPRVPHSGGIE